MPDVKLTLRSSTMFSRRLILQMPLTLLFLACSSLESADAFSLRVSTTVSPTAVLCRRDSTRRAPCMTLSPFPDTDSTAWPITKESDEFDLDQQNSESSLGMEQSRVFFPFENPLENPTPAVGRVLVLTAAAIYGTNFASVKMLDDAMPFAESAALRFSLAAAAVTGTVLYQEKQGSDGIAFNQLEREERNMATLAGMEVGSWYAIAYLAQAAGLSSVDASKSAFFNALAVMVVPLLDTAFKGKSMTTQSTASVVLAIMGVGLLQLGPPGEMGTFTTGIGDLFCLVQALCFGVGYWRLERASALYPNQSARNTAGQLIAVAIGSIIFCLSTQGVPAASDLQMWLTDGFIIRALMWTGLMSTAFALYLETVASRVLPASELTILMTSVSLWGSGFAVLTMGEALSPIDLLGGLMIMGGCVVSSLGKEPDGEE